MTEDDRGSEITWPVVAAIGLCVIGIVAIVYLLVSAFD